MKDHPEDSSAPMDVSSDLIAPKDLATPPAESPLSPPVAHEEARDASDGEANEDHQDTQRADTASPVCVETPKVEDALKDGLVEIDNLEDTKACEVQDVVEDSIPTSTEEGILLQQKSLVALEDATKDKAGNGEAIEATTADHDNHVLSPISATIDDGVNTSDQVEDGIVSNETIPVDDVAAESLVPERNDATIGEALVEQVVQEETIAEVTEPKDLSSTKVEEEPVISDAIDTLKNLPEGAHAAEQVPDAPGEVKDAIIESPHEDGAVEPTTTGETDAPKEVEVTVTGSSSVMAEEVEEGAVEPTIVAAIDAPDEVQDTGTVAGSPSTVEEEVTEAAAEPTIAAAMDAPEKVQDTVTGSPSTVKEVTEAAVEPTIAAATDAPEKVEDTVASSPSAMVKEVKEAAVEPTIAVATDAPENVEDTVSGSPPPMNVVDGPSKTATQEINVESTIEKDVAGAKSLATTDVVVQEMPKHEVKESKKLGEQLIAAETTDQISDENKKGNVHENAASLECEGSTEEAHAAHTAEGCSSPLDESSKEETESPNVEDDTVADTLQEEFAVDQTLVEAKVDEEEKGDETKLPPHHHKHKAPKEETDAPNLKGDVADTLQKEIAVDKTIVDAKVEQEERDEAKLSPHHHKHNTPHHHPVPTPKHAHVEHEKAIAKPMHKPHESASEPPTPKHSEKTKAPKKDPVVSPTKKALWKSPKELKLKKETLEALGPADEISPINEKNGVEQKSVEAPQDETEEQARSDTIKDGNVWSTELRETVEDPQTGFVCGLDMRSVERKEACGSCTIQ